MPEQQLTVITAASEEQHSVTLYVSGEIDHFTVQPLVDELETACAHGTDVIVDMADVAFMDVAGINCIARAASHLAPSGCTVLVSRAPVPIRRVFAICGAEVYLLPDPLVEE